MANLGHWVVPPRLEEFVPRDLQLVAEAPQLCDQTGDVVLGELTAAVPVEVGGEHPVVHVSRPAPTPR